MRVYEVSEAQLRSSSVGWREQDHALVGSVRNDNDRNGNDRDGNDRDNDRTAKDRKRGSVIPARGVDMTLTGCGNFTPRRTCTLEASG